MKNKTLILSPRFSTDSNDLWGATNRHPHWTNHRAINFTKPTTERDGWCTYGELTFCDIMAERCGLGLLDPPDDFLVQLPPSYLQRDIYCVKAGHIAKMHFDKKYFVKPANDKVFQRGIYVESYDVPLRYVDDECPCIVSSVVDFEVEVRLYCLDSYIETFSDYLMVSDLDPDQELEDAINFGQEALDQFGHLLPSAVVLDVGRISGGGWAVIEANQAYASGIYPLAKLDNILDVVYRSSGPIENVSESDKKFLRNK